MRRYHLPVLLVALILTSSSQAMITCSKPKYTRSTLQAPIYHFKATVTCELVDENINLKALKEAYLQDIVKKGSQFKVQKQENYTSSKGMIGYTLDVTQTYNTPNGAMAVRAKIIIADDQKKNFYYELRSRSIVADGDAKFEKAMINTTALEDRASKAILTVTKETTVEEPWYAPDSIFFGTVESKLKESIREAALTNARKICGQNVDPLRK